MEKYKRVLGKMLINNHEIEINRKDVKNINLKVYPDLSIKASIPKDMNISKVKTMIISKEEWIKNQLLKYENQIRITKREYVSGEDHYVNGKRYILRVYNSNTPSIKFEKNNTIAMYIRKNSSIENKEKLMNIFYKDILNSKIKQFLSVLEEKIGVKVNKYYIRKMKNKWGSCNTEKKEIIFNLELAKKKDAEIKYVITHELIHLIERRHNENFTSFMYKYCPKWEEYNESINKLLNNNKID